MNPEFSIEKYAKENKDDWNDFVAKSKTEHSFLTATLWIIIPIDLKTCL